MEKEINSSRVIRSVEERLKRSRKGPESEALNAAENMGNW